MRKNFHLPTSYSRESKRGFTLFVALVTAGTLLLVATSMIALAVRQARISASGRDSQVAFYAADTAMECALYWDVRNPGGTSAFATSTASSIDCNKDGNNASNQWVVGGSSVSTVPNITFLPEPYCAKIVVTKGDDGSTVIEAMGYNTCDSGNPRRVERAVRATY